MKNSKFVSPSALALAIASANSWGSTCSVGQYDVAGGSNCIDASPGFFVDSPGATEQIPAKAGHFVATFGATTDSPCELGTFAAVTGMSECEDAPPGRFVDTVAAEEAKVCLAGRFTASSQQTACTLAEPGSFVANEESTRSEPCPAGRYTNLPAQSSCLEAQPGSVVDEPGLTLSSLCPAGTFTETSGQSSCTESPPGGFVPVEGATEVTQCGVGTYTDTPKSTACTQASPGFFVGIIGASEPSQCSAGQYSESAGSSECFLAPAGSFVGEAGASESELCDIGKFTSSSGQSICTDAPLGTFVEIVGATESLICDLGKFTDTAGRSVCSLAPAGSFVGTTGASEAQVCTPGSFTSVAGSEECSFAEAGSHVPGFGGTESEACPPGRFSEFDRASVCELAPAGSFVSSSGQEQFEQCTLGTFTGSSGQSACEDAPAGSFVDTNGASQATLCAAGSFSATSGRTTCDEAEAGRFVSGQGATESVACPAGKYSEIAGAESCTDAAPGNFVASPGQTTSSQCPIGTFADSAGQSVCEEAPAGSFVPLAGSSEANLCRPGTYSATAANEACEAALPGSFVAVPGATGSELCEAGTFNNVSEATSCQLAPVGFFVANVGATAATACPAETFSETEGATICTNFVYGEIHLSNTRYSVNEEDGFLDILVQRSDGDDGELSVDFYLTDASAIATEDYQFLSGPLVFEDGETEKTIRVNIEDDTTYESDETFSVILNNLIGVDGTLGSPASAIVTIQSDDLAPEAGVLSFLSTSEFFSEDEENITVDVVREGGSAGTVSASYTATDGSALATNDYVATPGNVVFLDGETSQSILIPIINDGVYEPSETLRLSLNDIQGNAIFGIRDTEITIVDDDPVPSSGIVDFANSIYGARESSGDVDITLNRTDGSLGNVSVSIISSGGSASENEDYLFNSQVIEFEDGETSKTISITLIDDDIYEGDENILLFLSSESEVLGDVSKATVNIIEDDLIPAAGVLRFSGSEYIIDEDDANYSVTLTRINGTNGEITATITVNDISAEQNSDYSINQTDIFFSAGEISKTIDLAVIDDMEYESDESIRLFISSVDGGASIGIPRNADIIIRNNDIPPPSGMLNFTRSELIVNEDVGSIELQVIRSGGSFGEVSVDFRLQQEGSAILSSDYSFLNGTLIFSDGETSKTIAINIINDDLAEASEDFTILLDNAVNTIIGALDSTRIVISENDSLDIEEVPQSSSGGGPFNPMLWLLGLSLLPFRFFLNKLK